MIPVFVICLNRATARRLALEARFGSLGIPFQHVAAVDGQALSDAEALRLCPGRFRLRLRWPLAKAEIACTESHHRALQAILDSGAAFACVMEDDANPQAGMKDFLDTAMLESLPPFDAFKLGLEWAGRRDDWALPITSHGGRCICVPLRPTNSAIAYIVSRQGAQRLLQHGRRQQDTADVNFFRRPRMDARILEARPTLVTSIGDTSTIMTDPQFHRPGSRWRSVVGWVPYTVDQWERQVRRYSAFVRWQGLGALRRLVQVPVTR